VQVASLEELAEQADVLSLHVPLSKDTRNLIDARIISRMKPGLILINTARGPIVETASLYEGLRSGQIAAAGLDVLASEPPDPADPLIAAWLRGENWIRNRLVISPHAAFYSTEGYLDLRRKSMETTLEFLKHGTPSQ
jgi:phosphoglycerate dehydrogenase-like enzyme